MQPLLYAALAFATGILGAGLGPGWLAQFGTWPVALACGAACVVAATVGRSTRRLWTAAVAGLLFCAVAGYVRGAGAQRQAAMPAPLTALLGRLQPGVHDRVEVIGYLRDAPEVDSGAVRLDLEIVGVAANAPNAAPWPVTAGARLYSYSPGRDPESDEGVAAAHTAWPGGLAKLQAGEGVAAWVHLRPVATYRDPGVADRRAALAAGGIGYEATLAAGGWRPMPVVEAPRSVALRAKLWGWISRRVDAIAAPAAQPRENALLRGMMLGDAARLDDASRDALQADGVYHLVVVAGLHLAVLAGLLLGLLRRLRVPRAVATPIMLALLSSYAWVIAGRLPTVRALAMLGVYCLARLWYRERQALNAVGVAALGLLWVHPLDVFTPGWQMSVGAALLLAGVAQPLLARGLAPRRHACRQLGDVALDESFSPRLAQFRLELRLIGEHLGALWPPLARLPAGTVSAAIGVAELVVVAFVLQTGFAGFMAVYFHRAGMWSIAANAALVPLAGVLLPAGWLAVVAPPLGIVARTLAAWLLRLGLAIAAWPGAARRVPSPPNWALVFAAVAVVAWMIGLRRGRKLAAAGTLLAVAAAGLIVWAPFPPRLPPGLSVTVLDVGQGDAMLVVFPDGRTLLVDGGPRTPHWDSGEEVVAPFLWSLGLRHLDAVLLTHAHLDHIGGLPAVLRDVPPSELWVSASLPPTPEVAALVAQARAEQITLRRVVGGEAFQVGAAARVDVLLPPPEYQAGELASNDDSVTIRVASGPDVLLLPGDTQAAGESWMLAHNAPLAAQVLKVGHHGSATSSGAAFVAAVHPAVAVISLGAGNLYGFPAPAVLGRLAAARVFRTDRDGAVQCRLAAGRLEVWLWPQR